MVSSCSPDLLCLLPFLSDDALPLQRKTKATTVRWIWSTITECCRGLIYLAGPTVKNSPQENTEKLERAIPGQFSQLPLLPKLRPGNPSAELAQILTFLFVLPLQTSFLGSMPMDPHPFPNPVSLTLRQTFQNPWSPLDWWWQVHVCQLEGGDSLAHTRRPCDANHTGLPAAECKGTRAPYSRLQPGLRLCLLELAASMLPVTSMPLLKRTL